MTRALLMARTRTFRTTLRICIPVAFVCLVSGALQAVAVESESGSSSGSGSPYALTAPASSSTVTRGAILDAGTVGDSLLGSPPQLDVAPGGEKGLGVATVAGQKIDVNRLVPTTADPSYVTRLEAANNGKDLLGLKSMYDTEAAADQSKTGVQTQATTTVNNSAANRLYTTQNLAGDPIMNSSAAIINQSKGGYLLGQVFADCSTQTVPDNTTTTETLHQDKTCDKLRIPGNGGPACTRTREGTASYASLDASKDAKLSVTAGASGQQCIRTTTASQRATSLNQARDGTLSMSAQAGGVSCIRQISANAQSVSSPGSAQGDLPVDQQVGGHSCTRTVTVSGGGAQGNLGAVTVNFSVPGGRACSNDPTQVNIASSLPPGTTSISGIQLRPTQNTGYDAPMMVQTPTAANHWWAVFASYCSSDVTPKTSRANSVAATRLPGEPVGLVPVLFNGWIGYMSFTAYGGSGHTVGVQDTGNCGDAGTGNCPAKWSCAAYTPTTYGGATVSMADAESVAPLFPGAWQTCGVGSLDRTCNGSGPTHSTISIAAYIPAGVAQIEAQGGDLLLRRLVDGVLPQALAAPAQSGSFGNFQWRVTNPQPGVTVILTQAPSASNGWIAGFSVSRTDYTFVPQKPHISMTWTVSTSGGVRFGTSDQGNCQDPGSVTCPTHWTCTRSAPTSVGGYAISAADAASFAPLFPGASSTCVSGQLSRVCSGSSTVGSTIGIGDLLPAGARTINAFAWSVTNPNSQVTVALVSAPTFANGWTASFNVTAQNGGATPPAPQVHLTWTVPGPESIVIDHVDAGNCSAVSPSASCAMTWTCTGSAPMVINGVPVSAPNPSPLYPGASPACLNAHLDEMCSGTGAIQTSISIASLIYPGDTEISGYKWTVTTAIPGVAINQVQVPALSNNWVAIFETTRTEWNHAPAGGPDIHLSWSMNGALNSAFHIVDTGDCSATNTGYCKVAWTCDASAPVTVDGVTVSTDVIRGQPALFGGDGGACMNATLHYNCSSVWQRGGGKVCWTNAAGKTQCTDVPASGTPPDSCRDLQNDTSCVLKTSDCADGAMDTNGFCFVQTNHYDCITEVTVPTGNTSDVTTCTGAQPCLDGTCTAPSKTEGPNDRNDSMAKQLMIQTVNNDWEWTGTKTLAPRMPDPGRASSTQTQ